MITDVNQVKINHAKIKIYLETDEEIQAFKNVLALAQKEAYSSERGKERSMIDILQKLLK